MTYPAPSNRRLADSELTTVTDTVEFKVRAAFETRLVMPSDWDAGTNWYLQANAEAVRLGAEFGIPTNRVAGIIAALSPRLTWEQNLIDAREILERGWDAQTRALGPNMVKAARILTDGDPVLSVLGGPKVRAFYANIARPMSSGDVTIDGWIAYALELPPKDRPWQYLQRKGVYEAVSQGFRKVASDFGVPANVVQAALWIAVRNDQGMARIERTGQ